MPDKIPNQKLEPKKLLLPFAAALTLLITSCEQPKLTSVNNSNNQKQTTEVKSEQLPSDAEVRERMEPSMVYFEGGGSGFILKSEKIDDETYKITVATNDHVINDMQKKNRGIKVISSDKIVHRVTFARSFSIPTTNKEMSKIDTGIDLAFVTFISKKAYVPVQISTDLPIPEEVAFSVGFPHWQKVIDKKNTVQEINSSPENGLPAQVATTIIRNPADFSEGKYGEGYTISAWKGSQRADAEGTQMGMSGGALVNKEFKVIGMNGRNIEAGLVKDITGQDRGSLFIPTSKILELYNNGNSLKY